QILLYSAGIAVLLVVLSAWIVSQADEPPGGTCYWSGCTPLAPVRWSVLALADVFAAGLLGLGLFVLAPASVAAAVAAERRAGPLALHVLAGATGVIPVDSMAASLCVLVCGGLASTLLGLAVALAPRQESGGALVALGVAGVLGTAGVVAACFAAEPHAVPWA